jgi:hypothetical protein
VLIYINASWLDDIRVFIIPYEENEYQLGRARNERVFAAVEPKMLHAEGKLDGMCDYCSYAKSCNSVSVGRVPSPRAMLKSAEAAAQDTQMVEALDRLVSKHGDIKAVKKDAEAKLEEVNEQIRQALITHGQSRAAGLDWKIAYTAQKGRKTINKNLMIEAGLDPEDYMAEGAGFEKLTVTASK